MREETLENADALKEATDEVRRRSAMVAISSLFSEIRAVDPTIASEAKRLAESVAMQTGDPNDFESILLRIMNLVWQYVCSEDGPTAIAFF